MIPSCILRNTHTHTQIYIRSLSEAAIRSATTRTSDKFSERQEGGRLLDVRVNIGPLVVIKY